MFDQHKLPGADMPGEPGRQTVGGDIPAREDFGRAQYHPHWRPDRHVARADNASDRCPGISDAEAGAQTHQHLPELFHREQCEMMSDGVLKSNLCLRLPGSVGKWSAARHNDGAASEVRQDVDPAGQMSGADKTAAELDHDDVVGTHLVGRPIFARRRGE